MKRSGLAWEFFELTMTILVVGALWLIFNQPVQSLFNLGATSYPNAYDPSTFTWFKTNWSWLLLFIAVFGGAGWLWQKAQKRNLQYG